MAKVDCKVTVRCSIRAARYFVTLKVCLHRTRLGGVRKGMV